MLPVIMLSLTDAVSDLILRLICRFWVAQRFIAAITCSLESPALAAEVRASQEPSHSATMP
jgi:hypothetical protein